MYIDSKREIREVFSKTKEAYLKEISDKFPNGSYITTSWDTVFGKARCIMKVGYFYYNDSGNITCYAPYGINASNEPRFENAFGADDLEVRVATDEEIEEMEKNCNPNSVKQKPEIINIDNLNKEQLTTLKRNIELRLYELEIIEQA